MNIEIVHETKQERLKDKKNNDEANNYIYKCNYLYQFIKWGYFVGIIPFTPVIVHTQEQDIRVAKPPAVEFRRNRFQRIICWTIYLIGVFWTTLKLTNSYPDGGSLYATPSRILAVVSVLFQMTYVLSFAYTFGIQANRLKALLHSFSPFRQNNKFKGFLKFSRLIPILPLFLATFSTSLQFQEYLLRIPKSCQRDDNFQHDASSSSKIITFVPLAALMNCDKLEKYQDLLCFLTLAWHFSAELIYNSFQTFVLILAVSARNFAADILSNPNDLDDLLSTVEKLKEFFYRLNKVGSVPFLLFLCQMIPWTGYRFLDSLPDPKGILQNTSPISRSGERKAEYQESEEVYDVDADLLVKLYNWCILINGCFIIYFCAETKSLVQQLQDKLTLSTIQPEVDLRKRKNSLPAEQNTAALSMLGSTVGQPNPSSCALCKFIEISLKDVCIHGGPIFQFSYGYIGTIIGIITTLILFELQFGQNEQSFLTS